MVKYSSKKFQRNAKFIGNSRQLFDSGIIDGRTMAFVNMLEKDVKISKWIDPKMIFYKFEDQVVFGWDVFPSKDSPEYFIYSENDRSVITLSDISKLKKDDIVHHFGKTCRDKGWTLKRYNPMSIYF